MFLDNEMRGQKSRNPYHAKGFWLSDDIEILFDILQPAFALSLKK
ncbi:hypothetical protein [Anaerotignum lactatifermentans]